MREQVPRPSADSPRWSATPLIYASAAIHAGAAAALVLRPRTWPWALGALAINHAALAAAGLWPRSQLLGPNWVTLPRHGGESTRVAITIDDGPDPEVTPQVCRNWPNIARPPLSFAWVNASSATRIWRRKLWLAAMPSKITANGIGTISRCWGRVRMSAEISRAQDSISRVTGIAPLFFRAPAGLRNPFLDPILARLQLRLASWTRRGFDTVHRNADAVYQRLAMPLRDGDILLLHDGNAARAA